LLYKNASERTNCFYEDELVDARATLTGNMDEFVQSAILQELMDDLLMGLIKAANETVNEDDSLRAYARPRMLVGYAWSSCLIYPNLALTGCVSVE
jgi:hypothetical protein